MNVLFVWLVSSKYMYRLQSYRKSPISSGSPLVHPNFWGCGDVGTAYLGYTRGYSDSLFLYTLTFLGDMRTVLQDIHVKKGTAYTTHLHSHFWECGEDF